MSHPCAPGLCNCNDEEKDGARREQYRSVRVAHEIPWHVPWCPYCGAHVTYALVGDYLRDGLDFATTCEACGQPVLVSVSRVMAYRVAKLRGREV